MSAPSSAQRDAIRGTSYERGYNADYRGLRRALLATPGPCYWGCGRVATTADHVVPLARGGMNVADNLVPSLFASFADCNDGAGLVDVINDPTCTLYRSDTGESFANWAEFIVEHENTYIAREDNYAFIIADGSGAEGVWTISNMKVGKPGN